MTPTALQTIVLTATLLNLTPTLLAAPERGFVSSQPAATWENSLVSGNGKLGAMVMSQPQDETVILNHARLYMPLHQPLPPVDTASHLNQLRQLLAAGQYQPAADLVVELANKENYNGKRWTDPFIPACDLKIKMPAQGELRDYQRSVDFQTGVASVQWSDDRGQFQRRLFVSRADDAIVLSITGPAGSLNCDLQLAQRSTKTNGWNPKGMVADGIKSVQATAEQEWLTYRNQFKCSWPGSLQGYETAARVIAKGTHSKTTTDPASLHVQSADEILILIRIDLLSDFGRSALPALKQSLSQLTPDFTTLLNRHTPLHSAIFNRARLDLAGGPDRALTSEQLIAKSKVGDRSHALLEKQFDACRYAILSSTGELFPNLQGIWTGTWGAPWSGDFTMNGNVQSAIAADLSANMPELLLPYFRYLESQLPQYRDNAKRLYGCRGIHVPSRASTHGWNNHFDATWPMTFWTAGAGWASQFFYDYYLYTGDRDFLLHHAIPFMKESALFYEDFLIAGPDGKYLFSPSYSPENNPSNSKSQSCINATMDIAVCRELLTNLIAACKTAGIESDSLPRWQSMLARLPDYQINSDGAIKEWSTPILQDNYAHRHCSHLYALYTGLPPDIAAHPDLRKAFQRTAELRMEIRRKENGGIMAFGLVQLGLAASSLRDPDMSHDVVDWLSNNYWNPNLVSTHNPKAIFNTDLCGGLPAIVIKMLVDSRPGSIDLLPALPKQWPTGQLQGALCRGQVELKSLAWTPTTVTATLLSPIPQTIQLRYNHATPIPLTLTPAQPLTVEFPR